MKKELLIALSLLPACLYAQNNTTVVNPKVDVPVPVFKKFLGTDQATSPFKPGSTYTPKLNKHIRYSSILIGKTFYDLQTNASVGRRIILHSDGKISAVWTTASIGQAEWPTRGTGYNHKTTSWKSTVNARFETERTGWPGIGILDSAGTKYEMVMGHIATTGGWIISKNNAIGSSSFPDQKTVLTQLNDKVSIWGRVATNDKKIIHLVSNYNGSTTGTPPMVKIKGVSSPSTYSRSTNGGLTWDKQFITLPGYDSTRTLSGGGDQYAIDVKDNIVAIVIGGTGEDVALYKSLDNGNTFTRTVVEEFPFSPWDITKNKHLIPSANRQKTADGSFDVLIGNDNKVHVFFGRTFVFDDDTTADGTFFSPGSAQLIHWAEGWDSVNVCGAAKDYDGDNALTITAETTSAPDPSGNLPANVSSATRYGGTSLVSFPSSSMDANGNLYVIYSAPNERALSPFNANYRDIYVSFSTDGGQTWNIGQNLTATSEPNNFENVFGSAAKRSDNFLHFIYQEDDLPGTNLQNNGNSNTHPNDEQRIMYKAVPVADILGGQIRDAVSVKKALADPKIFFVSQNQPNPFSSETQAYIYMRDGSDITLS
ncbi:MAG: hypothetical protein ACKVQB_07460, partial [Bacteroidia bacterium]